MVEKHFLGGLQKKRKKNWEFAQNVIILNESKDADNP